ncbi:MAG: hypothetical protein QNJ45_21695 [Ardenticatenaceae bacterium]|nr:hypothetical protein [Ardenticatenaceae bacterium]
MSNLGKHSESYSSATFFLTDRYLTCQLVGRWMMKKPFDGLTIVPAGQAAGRPLTKMVYESSDCSQAASGAAALGHALSHLTFGWAFLGAILRFPPISYIIEQLINLLIMFLPAPNSPWQDENHGNQGDQ